MQERLLDFAEAKWKTQSIGRSFPAMGAKVKGRSWRIVSSEQHIYTWWFILAHSVIELWFLAEWNLNRPRFVYQLVKFCAQSKKSNARSYGYDFPIYQS